jgi:hypothetical protein
MHLKNCFCFSSFLALLCFALHDVFVMLTSLFSPVSACNTDTTFTSSSSSLFTMQQKEIEIE